MRRLVAGNWKMNGSAAMAAGLMGKLTEAGKVLPCDVVVCPPAPILGFVAHLADGSAVSVGAQDCHARAAGAHTGDVSAAMLREAGASWVILGHSERRADHAETDALIRAKVAAAASVGLIPIVCVGETLVQREAGDAEGTVGVQLAASLPDGFYGAIAYEPVWAIGTGRTPSVDDVAAMHRFIRARLAERFGEAGADMRILYGGSVKPDNAASLLAADQVGGALVGGASLVADDFLAICRAAG